jgi:hypothetical protein
MRSFRARFAGALLLLVGAPLLGGACGDGGGGGAGGVTGGTGGISTTLHPSAPPLPGESACTVVEVTDIPETSASHVATCTSLTYATNPPSGGDHWAIWAAFREYTRPVPHEMLVHDLEHGAIVLLYRCADGCPDVVAALDSVFKSQADPLCLGIPGGPPARMVLAPDPALETPIAAAAWGATYTATCIDKDSLQKFVNDHYGHGPEQLCTNGTDVEGGSPCADGG